MVIHETTSEPIMASVNGQPPAQYTQKLRTHMIQTQEDAKDFHIDMAGGRDIVSSYMVGDVTYIITRQLVPGKIALPTKDLM